MDTYIFTSKRLGFRNWKKSDLSFLFEMNSNKEVMKYFPSIQSEKQCEDFIDRMQKQFEKHKYCYFAVEKIETKKFIGFIGLSLQTYEADFNPSVDIGWRLLPDFWRNGYATEGAKRCLHYGFEVLNLHEIVSVAPEINIASITVMEKIGMKKHSSFKHPLLQEYPTIAPCVLYTITNTEYN